MMLYANIILGVILLVFGRRLFWLFVAIAGFLVGITLGNAVLADQPEWVLLLVSLGAGLLGALLAVLAERVAFAVAGFYAGSYLALIVAQSFAVDGNNILWFVLGGAVGTILATLVMDWAIIALSCLVGAAAIVHTLDLEQTVSFLVFVTLVITGAFLQAKLTTRSQAA